MTETGIAAWSSWRGRALAALAASLWLAVAPARGATFAVDDTADAVDQSPGDGACRTVAGGCSLRAAVQETNALVGADTINIPAGIFTLTVNGLGEDACVTGDLDIRDSLELLGAGTGATILDGARLDRVLDVRGAIDVRIADLTLRDGDALTTTFGGLIVATGGALVVQRCDLIGGRAGSGGAMVTSGQTELTLEDCLITDNSGGGTGALDLGGDVAITLTRCSLRRNTGGGVGGGLRVTAGGALIIADSDFVQNAAASGGGMRVESESATITDTLVDGNLGAGIVLGLDTPVALRSVAITSNEGGGLFLLDGATLDFRGGTVDGNSSTISGGGIYVDQPFRRSPGIQLDDVTISNNHADDDGGGLFLAGAGASDDVAWLTNCTISGNSADGNGGGIWASHATVTARSILRNCTITNNMAMSAGGIHAEGSAGQLLLANTIVAGNISGTGGDCAGELESQGHNIWGDATGSVIGGQVALDLVDVDPLLGPLQANGGSTLTHAPLGGSPALDGGDPAGCMHADGSALGVDQRGAMRPVDGDGDAIARCDVGAVEVDCGADSDGDGLGDACDCAPADGSVRAVPDDVRVDVTHDIGSTDGVIAWSDRTAQAGSATVYDVASDLLSVLWTLRAAEGPCLVRGVAPSSVVDARPVVDDGFYYLVRAWNACGPPAGEGWGVDSLNQPRLACP